MSRRRRNKTKRGLVAGQPLQPTPFIEQLEVAEATAREEAMDPHRLARKVLAQLALADGQWTWRNWNGQLYQWRLGRYQAIPEDHVKALITGALKKHFQERVDAGDDRVARQVTPARVNGVLNAIRSLLLVQADSLPVWLEDRYGEPEVFAFRNGLLPTPRALEGVDLRLDPPDPRWFSRVCFPYAFDPKAVCPHWLLFLTEVLPEPSDRQLLQEIFGYCLVPDTRYQKFFLFEGRGANGKSVVTSVLTELLGDENVSSVGLDVFDQRFALEPTVDKLANIVNEIGNPRALPESHIKQFVGGERMTIDRKGISAIQVLPTARIIVTTNELPAFKDHSDGIARRLVPLRFPVTIPEAQRKPTLVQDLKQELPGIFLWALEGLRRLRVRGAFELPESSLAMLEEMRPEPPSSVRFLREYGEPAPGEWIATDDLYAAYSSVCADWGEKPEPKNGFCQRIAWVFPEAKKQRESSGPRRHGYAGLRLKGLNSKAA